MPLSPGESTTKNSKILINLLRYDTDPMLSDIADFVIQNYGLTITEHYRPTLHPNDLHGTLPVRAIDIRCWDYPGDWREVCQKIVAAINARWTYDPKRKHLSCAILHRNRGSFGTHIHIQTHPRTEENQA